MSQRRKGLRSRGLAPLIIGLCGGTALIVGGIFSVLLISVVNLRSEDAHARRASDLLVRSSTVEQSVVDLETGLRGYLITQEPAFLAPYRQAQERLPGELAALRKLLATQLERYQLDRISRAIRSYVRGYAQPLIATGGRLSRAEEVRITVEGKRLLDRLRPEFSALTNGELALRDRQRAAADSRSANAISIAAVGLGGSVLLLIGLGIYLLSRLLAPTRTVADAARRLAAGELNARVPEVGLGEVALLAQSFNTMASELQTREHELARARDQLTAALDEARKASSAKSNFLANMSHEIRTPLNGVIGMMDLLSDTPLSTEQREYVSVAKASGEALMVVVSDVLDIAKIEAGRLELEHRDFDLHELAEAACDMVAATSGSKGLNLQSFVHDDVPAVVRGDRMRLGQILSNLLSNAVKFTPEGEVVLEVAPISSVDSKIEIKFEVRDTGIGIAPDRLAELFESFTQADAGTTRTYGGTGLGLSIVRELTRMMGGRIDVESQPGEGSTFSCVVPLQVAQREPQHLPPQGLRGLNVLILDDNPTNRRIFEAYVASWEMHPTLADSGEAAMSQLNQAAKRGDPFDVALLDFHMPDASGIDVAKRIRAAARLRRTRLILLTSSGETTFEEPGCIDYLLTKPVRQSRLLDAISTVINRHQPDADQDAHDEKPVIAERARTGHRILVAEDQAVNWMLVERLLSKRGHFAHNAVDGREALEMLKAGTYDLVLMDCQMPALDGYSAARAIRQREAAEGGKRTPIVAMTANALEGDRDRCLAAGMDDYLAKPITTASIDEVLDRWLPRGGEAAELILDPARIEELDLAFPGEERVEMLERLQREVAEQLRRIATALHSRDGAEAVEAAHRIVSSARLIGADDLARAAIALQTCADEDRDDARRLQAEVTQHWLMASAALRAQLLERPVASA